MWPRTITDAVGRLLRLDGRLLWRVDVPDGSKEVYLTFDDGPMPECPWVTSLALIDRPRTDRLR